MTATNLDSLAVTGAVTAGSFTGPLTGNTAGTHTGGVVTPAPTAYSGADAASKAISPALFVASLTKALAGTDYTLAAPGAGNVNKFLYIYSTTAAAHVVTVAGLAGGNTMTLAAAIGNGFMLYAVSATVWTLVSTTGGTQSQVG
jgi:hypothetical protein